MPNLVGIGLSQVPTNSMLGGLAYQDPEHASIKDLDLKNLSQINSEISDTAVDVFVYDTRKDSDGGAWRKRTQHTSWYNETLNTATRGSRREFPAVAVIVVTAATTRKLYIYDGDDPDLPMWMVIDTIDGQWPQVESSSLHALNGIIALGSSSDNQPLYETRNRLDLYYFVSDKIESSGGAGGSYYGTVGGLVNRRSHAANLGSPLGNSVYPLVNIRVNDVAMTVLPNAPIDDATGLPRPTIAVGTDGGASIIKDDGSVVDITITTGTNYDVEHIDFTDDNRVVILWNAGGGEITIDEIPSADTSANYPINLPGTYYNDHSPASYSPGFLTEGPSISNRIPAAIQQFRAVGTTAALSLFEENKQSEEDGMVAFISSSYNTGYQQGRIRGAFLSDTDTTNVTGEKIDLTNGSVPAGNNASVASITANQLVFQSSSETVGRYDTGTFLVTGKQYHATLTISNYSGSGTMGLASGGGFDGTFRYSANGTYTRYITGDDANEVQLFYRNTNSGTVGLTIKEVDRDRSLNNKGLEVYGTITKSAVATGADLVAYSNFSTSNYLLQPPNSDLAFGNNAFSVMCWFKTTQDHSATTSAILIEGDDGSNQKFDLRVHSDEKLLWQVTDDGYSTRSRIYQAGPAVDDGAWHCVVGTRTSDNKTHLYLDGSIIGSSTSESAQANLSNSIVFSIGLENAFDGTKAKPWGGSVALVRISKSVPSPEQIKKMYEDEKHLFQENAKATLYGSSDAVTALGYDDSTNLLYAGTSAGRSEFQGLRRINNTTTAVTTAISASNGLVAEQ